MCCCANAVSSFTRLAGSRKVLLMCSIFFISNTVHHLSHQYFTPFLRELIYCVFAPKNARMKCTYSALALIINAFLKSNKGICPPCQKVSFATDGDLTRRLWRHPPPPGRDYCHSCVLQWTECLIEFQTINTEVLLSVEESKSIGSPSPVGEGGFPTRIARWKDG